MIARRIATHLLAVSCLAALACGKKEEESSGGYSSPSTKRDSPASESDESKRKASDVKKLKPKDTAPEAPKVEEKYSGVNEWVQVGDVRIRITGVKIQKVPLLTSKGGKYASKEPELMIWVEVENTSKVKKITYSRWERPSFGDGDRSALTDEHKNTYSFSGHNKFGAAGSIEGAVGYKEMRPGDASLTDIVCFDVPVEAATELRLTLAAMEIGERGRYRFRIPAAEWK